MPGLGFTLPSAKQQAMGLKLSWKLIVALLPLVSGLVADDHAVPKLPGAKGALKSKHYAGYLPVDEKAGRQLFYYLVESERDPAGDPVVLWLNGGPGCSSFDGFVFEHGPFNFKFTDASATDVYLEDNPYAWNKVANMLFIDSPAGVGFSYSQDKRDYITNDTHTAQDAHKALRAFFTLHPQLQANRFFISGESYAGIYVPNLVQAVVKGNEAGAEPHINMEGYLVGNGCTDEQVDGNAFPLFAMGKSLIPVDMFMRLQRACKGNFWNASDASDCGQLLSAMQDDLSYLNLYDVLQDCYHWVKKLQPQQLASYQQIRRSHKQWPVTGAVKQGQQVKNWAHMLGMAPPCTDSRAADIWLNKPEVRKAIHAEPVEAIGAWTLCTRQIYYTHDTGSMVPIHREMTSKYGVRALIYSGDHDLCVPHTGSEAWTRAMGYGVEAEWQPWFVADKQVAGYTVAYANQLTYATVKGAGHMVPQTNPREALAMFDRFISGQPLYPVKPSSAASATAGAEAVATA